MKNNITELVFILDRSGSMSGLETDTIGGFNGMIESQKKEDGKAYVTTVLFNQKSVRIHDRVSLAQIEPMTAKEYTVGGMTALMDALGDTIRHISDIHRYIRPEDVPAKTVFVITTDGLENASRRYSSDEVKKLITAKQKEGWEFLFLGANIDAVETAARYGIDEDRAVTFKCDAAGTQLNYKTVSDAVACARSGRKLDRSWKEPIENDVKKRGR